jgi:hypothetical protein
MQWKKEGTVCVSRGRSRGAFQMMKGRRGRHPYAPRGARARQQATTTLAVPQTTAAPRRPTPSRRKLKPIPSLRKLRSAQRRPSGGPTAHATSWEVRSAADAPIRPRPEIQRRRRASGRGRVRASGARHVLPRVCRTLPRGSARRIRWRSPLVLVPSASAPPPVDMVEHYSHMGATQMMSRLHRRI